ncbi:hypothetical protein EYM_06840 [Ignicoccus islandicus DSM 13165]|uniref:THIF-type NAD/FAD binding fold domain-containing protein n=1 Tax=Ignicoccus islandicus DSM 13165 TaxID=940295 RepID=A0A0U3FLL6_9CREN|nr:ThiF family adenylyltransferase [Ignicoccus islandicus]ALU12726.1 hypothetical protein EYM_06840 [Ignicoccus islandicus DSM 13165]
MKRVLIVGAGALGSWTAEILSRKGPFSFYIVDPDRVEESNLDRQLFYPQDVGKYKAEVLAQRITLMGNDAQAIISRIEDVEGISADIALALTDNIPSRIFVEERYFPTIHGMVRPEVGMVLMTTNEVKLSNLMTEGKHTGAQDVSMVVSVASLVARLALDYLIRGDTSNAGKLFLLSRYSLEVLDLE